MFFCREHKKSWDIGSNLFSSWRDETEDEQRAAWDEAGLEDCKRVEPIYPTQPLTSRLNSRLRMWWYRLRHSLRHRPEEDDGIPF